MVEVQGKGSEKEPIELHGVVIESMFFQDIYLYNLWIMILQKVTTVHVKFNNKKYGVL